MLHDRGDAHSGGTGDDGVGSWRAAVATGHALHLVGGVVCVDADDTATETSGKFGERGADHGVVGKWFEEADHGGTVRHGRGQSCEGWHEES